MIQSIISVTAAEVFTYIGYIIAAVLTLMCMIIIHELGHYTAGKLLGFKIDEFGIGFGPAIIKKKNSKTGEVFSLRPFPIGGFCSFHGEDEDGGDDSQAFNNQKPWKRLIVLFSGAFMNFLSAIVIITIYFTAYGQILPVVVNTHDGIMSESSFKEGDVILRIGGKQVNILLEEDIFNVFSGMEDTEKFTVLRDGKRLSFTASKQYYYPFEGDEYVYSVNGETVETPYSVNEIKSHLHTEDDVNLVVVTYNEYDEIVSETTCSVKYNSETDQYLSYGFGITRSLTRAKLPFFLAFARSWGFSFYVVFKILATLGALITGKLGAEAAGGTITTITTMAKVTALGFDNFLYVVAIISANLAVMNLMPFPALDGSRMVFTLIEMIFRKPVPRKVEAVIHTVGLILLIVLAVFLDVFHLVRG